MNDNQTTPAGGRTHFVGFGPTITQNCNPDIAPKSFRVVWYDLDDRLVRWTPWYGTEQQAMDAAIAREKLRPQWALDYTRSMQSRPF